MTDEELDAQHVTPATMHCETDYANAADENGRNTAPLNNFQDEPNTREQMSASINNNRFRVMRIAYIVFGGFSGMRRKGAFHLDEVVDAVSDLKAERDDLKGAKELLDVSVRYFSGISLDERNAACTELLQVVSGFEKALKDDEDKGELSDGMRKAFVSRRNALKNVAQHLSPEFYLAAMKIMKVAE